MAARGFTWYQQTIRRVESGRQSVKLEEAGALAEILGVPVDLFLLPPAETQATEALHAARFGVNQAHGAVSAAVLALLDAVSAAEHRAAMFGDSGSDRVKEAREEVLAAAEDTTSTQPWPRASAATRTESRAVTEKRTRKANLESTISEVPNARGYFEGKVWMGTKADGKPDRRHVQRKTLAAVRKRVRELERSGTRPHHQGRQGADRAADARAAPDDHAAVARHRAKDDLQLPVRLPQPHHRLWGGQKIDRVSPEHIEDGVAQMLAEGLPSHVRKVLAILSSAYEVQVERGDLPRNPVPAGEAAEAPAGRPLIPVAGSRCARSLRQLLAGDGARWSVGLRLRVAPGRPPGTPVAVRELRPAAAGCPPAAPAARLEARVRGSA